MAESSSSVRSICQTTSLSLECPAANHVKSREQATMSHLKNSFVSKVAICLLLSQQKSIWNLFVRGRVVLSYLTKRYGIKVAAAIYKVARVQFRSIELSLHVQGSMPDTLCGSNHWISSRHCYPKYRRGAKACAHADVSGFAFSCSVKRLCEGYGATLGKCGCLWSKGGCLRPVVQKGELFFFI